VTEDLGLIELAAEKHEEHHAKERRTRNPHGAAPELLVHHRRDWQEPSANGVDRKPVGLREREGRRDQSHGHHGQVEEDEALSQAQARKRVGLPIEHQMPEGQPTEHGAPTHHLVESVVQHGIEEDRRQEPHELGDDVERGRDSSIEQEMKRPSERADSGLQS